MKKMLNTALFYAVLAMIGGVFYREFTKLSGFDSFVNKTTLSVVHTHFFLLGMVVFLLAALFAGRFDLAQSKKYRFFYPLYNVGVLITGSCLAWRGILQVLGTPLSRGLDASISGIAGIGHILTGTGLIILLLVLRERAALEETAAAKS